MSVEDFESTNGDVRIKVTGLKKLVRDMSKAGTDAEDIKGVMAAAGNIVARRAVALSPVRTGKLKGDVRVGQAKTKATVKVGSASVPYARFVYFGKYNASKGGLYQSANPFIYNALIEKRGEVLSTIEDGFQDILEKNDLL